MATSQSICIGPPACNNAPMHNIGSTIPSARLVETSRGRLAMEVRGEGPDLVLLHSLLTDRHGFDPVVPALSSHWRVNQVDLPGFGGSVPVAGSTIDDWADALGALLDEGDFDPRSTCVIGNGLGAFLALALAVRHGQLFDRLVLIGCGSRFSEEGRAAFLRMAEVVANGGMAAVAETALRRIYSEDYLLAHPEQAEERRRVLLQIDARAFQAACAALARLDYSGEVGRIRNATLVVTGADDQATPPSLGTQLAESMPVASFRLLPGLAHAPQLQDPEALLAAIGPFLDLAGNASAGGEG
jgi:3-oxoadipate enol-lactonase